MRPAFDSTRQAAAFALLLAALLALPVALAHSGWLKRSDVYPAIPWKYGPFPWIQQQIFEKTNDVDIAFVGSSLIWCDVNTPYVQKALSEKLGRDAEVFTLGWPWPGFDADYIIARDLLQHRRVKMVVIYDETRENLDDAPHLQSARWIRVGDDREAFRNLPARAHAALYGSAVLGAPRSLLSVLRPEPLDDPSLHRTNIWDTLYRADNIADQRGALRAHLGFNNSPDFSPYSAPVTATQADVAVYTASSHTDTFAFRDSPLPPYGKHFLEDLAALCARSGTRLVVLHPPTFPDRAKTNLVERQNWTAVLPGTPAIIGIPGAKLFAGAAPEDISRFYYNKSHLNANGQDRFTPLITPALLDLYDTDNH